MNEKLRAAAFSILVTFIAVMLVGAALIPRLSVRLQPSRSLPELTVTYSWQGANPRLIEQEVTALLEGLFNTIKGITKIESVSRIGSGSITLSYDPKADPDAIRFEVASKVREAYPKFPDGVRYPVISSYRTSSEARTLLTYTLNASSSPILIQQYAEEHIKPKLADIPGLYRINISGATMMEWELEYDQEQLLTLGLSRNQIIGALNTRFTNVELGMGWDLNRSINALTSKRVLLRTVPGSDTSWQEIPVAEVNGRIIRIRDLCKIRHKEQAPRGYYRINGNNTVTLRFSIEKNANSLKVAAEVKQRLARLSSGFPRGYNLLLSSDSTSFIRDELHKIFLRTLFSFAILLLFVWLTSKRLRYLLIILISLLANLLTAVIFYYLVKVEINLYSLAGITVSLGIIIDNTIVMVDHMRTQGNRKVFLAILAATLTTIGALSVIRFFGENTRLMLKDFSMVLIINLIVSLLVALLLVPSLMKLIGLDRKKSQYFKRKRRWVVYFSHGYEKIILFAQRFRWAFIVAAILLFGLPVFMLPTQMKGDQWYCKLYRATFASETYVQKIKPVTDKLLGGTLRLFRTRVYSRYYYRMPERTKILVRAALPQGATLDQMNDLMIEVERYLTGREQIDQFITMISSPRLATVTVDFKPDYELGAFPYVLYSQLQDFSNKMTGADWWVQGIGQGFSNSLSERVGSQQITLYGYNFEKLWGYAEEVKKKVESHMRVDRAAIMSERTWAWDPVTEYRIWLNNEEMFRKGFIPEQIYRYLQGFAIQPDVSGHLFVNNRYEPVRLRSVQSEKFDSWMMGQTPITTDSTMIRLIKLGEMGKQQVNKTIVKEDQQYQLTVAYDFKGAYKLAAMHRERVIDEVSAKLPVGFLVKESAYRYWQREKNRQFFLILLVIGIIYMICSILLESLLQPLAVVLIIPVSFVGVFLTFYLFDFSFDQGGFASFLLLSGIVVNASLYILNDYNNLRKEGVTHLPLSRLYLKAYNGKITPIFLTVMSTVLGLVPFVTGGQDEVFWFALAVGTMGGLIFSFLALIIFLPAFLSLSLKKSQSTTSYEK